jgi:hypothetical protein
MKKTSGNQIKIQKSPSSIETTAWMRKVGQHLDDKLPLRLLSVHPVLHQLPRRLG